MDIRLTAELITENVNVWINPTLRLVIRITDIIC